MIHPTAKIHPTAIVEDGARVGARTIVMEFAIIRSCVEVGEDCEIMEGVILGALPMSYSRLERKPPLFGVKVGDRVHFHSNVVVFRGMKRPTTIGDDCALGSQSTLGHDAKLGNMVVIQNHSTLAGWVETGDFVTIHLNVTIRERKKIGYNVAIGMCSNVTNDIPSNSVAYGNPCRVIRKREHPIKYFARRIRDFVS